MNTHNTRWTILAIILFSITGLHAQYRFVPHVVGEDRTDSITFEYKVSDFTTHAEFEINGTYFEMFDNGQNGDRIAGDRIFTISFDPQVIVDGMQADDGFRPYVGNVHPFIGDDSYKFTEVFAQVRTSEMPDVPIASYGTDLRISPRVINIRSNSAITYQQVFQRLSAFGISRETDFLVIVRLPSQTAVHTFTSLRNNVMGTGRSTYDLVQDGNIPARFKGVLDMPISSRFDGISRIATRSLAKQWVGQLGSPYSACEHWAVSDLARSILGYDKDALPLCHQVNFQYNIVKEAGSNDYQLVSSPINVKYFNSLELYLMGLGPASQVPQFKVFRNQDAVLNALKTNPLGYRGPVDTYTISDVINNAGQRLPAFGDAPTEFRVYTVVVSPQFLTREEMAYYDYMAGRGESTEILPTRDGVVKELGVSFKTATTGAGNFSWKIHNMTFPSRQLSEELCDGENFVFNGVEYTEPGTYSDIIENGNGKDTLVQLELNWLPISEVELEEEICTGEIYEFNGRMLDTSGIYIDTMINAFGCDSLVTLDLSVFPSESVETFERICSDEIFIFAGDTITEPGVYLDMQTNIYGCDSSTTLTLEVDPAVQAGVISATGNQQSYTFCIEDGLQDLLWFSSSADTSSYVYIITDRNNKVLDIVFEPVYDFENTGLETELVWGVSYTGTFLLNRGDILFSTDISDECYDITQNFIEVHKQREGAICAFVHEKPFGSDATFTIAPNPVSDILNIRVSWPHDEPEAADVSLEIIGVKGEMLHRREIAPERGLNTWNINVSELVPGLYIVRIDGVGAQRFIKS